MSSSAAVWEETSKTRPEFGRRLMMGAIILLTGSVIVLISGVVLMQTEISVLKSTLQEFEALKEEVSVCHQEAMTSAYVKSGKGRITPERQIKGKRVRVARSLALQGNCELITIPFCQNMPYTVGQFPNLLNQTQDEVKATLATSNFGRLLDSGCSPDMEPLLCSVLAPPCNGTRTPVAPCKELCKRATKSCKSQLRKLGIKFDSSMRCRILPKESTFKCFNGSWPNNTPATGCKPALFDQCAKYTKRTPPWNVQFPNYFGHMNEEQARAGFNRFDPIWSFEREKCSSTLADFLCHMYAPLCSSSKTRFPPCRELCLNAKTRCKPPIKQASKKMGFTWPNDLRCKNFPRKGRAPCYMGRTTEVAVTSSPPLVSGKCQLITVPLCKGVQYNMTTFPNFFRHKTQEEAALVAHQFWPLVQVNCSPDMAFFLCSLYTPLCSTLDSPPPPCRDLCLRVKEGCLPLMLKFGFSWPESMACEQFPVGGVGTICLDTPNTLTTKPQLPTASKTRGRCNPLTIPLCFGRLHYNMTRFPNFLKHSTQEEAALEVHQFFPLVKVGCSPDLAPFLCYVYAPPCKGPRKPCRELCNRAKSGCAPVLREFGINWPESLECEKFPVGGVGDVCINTPNVSSLTTQPTHLTASKTTGRCNPVTIPLCFGRLHYNMTRFPNNLKHSTQEEAALEVHQFFPLVKVGCSPDLAPFLCYVYAPPCKGPRKPCRELCKRARNGCSELMRRFGFTWPESLRCEKFPTSTNGSQCIGPDVQSTALTKTTNIEK